MGSTVGAHEDQPTVSIQESTNSLGIELGAINWPINLLLNIGGCLGINLSEKGPETSNKLLARPFAKQRIFRFKLDPAVPIKEEGNHATIAKAEPPIRLSAVSEAKSPLRRPCNGEGKSISNFLRIESLKIGTR